MKKLALSLLLLAYPLILSAQEDAPPAAPVPSIETLSSQKTTYGQFAEKLARILEPESAAFPKPPSDAASAEDEGGWYTLGKVGVGIQMKLDETFEGLTMTCRGTLKSTFWLNGDQCIVVLLDGAPVNSGRWEVPKHAILLPPPKSPFSLVGPRSDDSHLDSGVIWVELPENEVFSLIKSPQGTPIYFSGTIRYSHPNRSYDSFPRPGRIMRNGGIDLWRGSTGKKNEGRLSVAVNFDNASLSGETPDFRKPLELPPKVRNIKWFGRKSIENLRITEGALQKGFGILVVEFELNSRIIWYQQIIPIFRENGNLREKVDARETIRKGSFIAKQADFRLTGSNNISIQSSGIQFANQPSNQPWVTAVMTTDGLGDGWIPLKLAFVVSREMVAEGGMAIQFRETSLLAVEDATRVK